MIAAIYDIHGNLPALEAVLGEIRRADVEVIVVGGDVLPGPMPAECLTLLRDAGVPTKFISGNGDRAVLDVLRGGEPTSVPAAYHDIIRWNARQLGREDRSFLESWETTLRLHVSGLGDVLFCHATPRNDMDIFTVETPEDRLRPLFEGARAKVVVCGHTHMPFDRMIGQTRVVNAGSVGMPFGAAGSDWLLLRPDVELCHTSYDLEAAARRIRATSYPAADEFASKSVLHPPSTRQMLDAYSRVPLSTADGPSR